MRLPSSPLRVLLLAVAYFVVGRAGLSLASVNPSASAVFPASGLALAAMLLWETDAWLAVLVGAFLVNMATSGSVPGSFAIGVGNTVAAVAAAHLARRFASAPDSFNSLPNVFRFVFIPCAGGAAVAATLGVTTLCATGLAEWPRFGSVWLTWWLGDAAGAVLVAPLILLWMRTPLVAWSAARTVELSALAGSVIVTGWFVFFLSTRPIGFICLGLCVWAASRFGPRKAVTVACVLSLIAVFGTVRGHGAFGQYPPAEALWLVQAFMAFCVTIALAVGAAVVERRAAEERLQGFNRELETRVHERTRELQTILDAEPACVKVVSADGRLLEMNAAGLAMIEAESASAVLGRPVVDIVHPDDRARFLEVHDAAYAGSPGHLEFRIIGLKGVERWVDSHLVPFDISVKGVPGGRAVLSVTSDVTERKRLEDQLHHSQKMEAVGLLAGGVAHDFNNLLIVITGFTEMVASSLSETDDRRVDLLEVLKAADRAAGLTRQLLAFSRRQMLQPRVFDTSALIGELQQLLQRTIPEHIHLVVSLDHAVEPIRADPGQIEQVLLNLAVNAADAMPAGGELRITTSMADVDGAAARLRPPMPPGRYVKIGVRDTGVGIPPEIQTRIFEPFFTTKAAGKGTGLGLATVYGTVKQSGGFIWVTSQQGKGTTFEIFLPVVHEPLDAPSAAPAGRAAGGTETILLAEDDGAVRRLISDVLQKHGYTVLEAAGGEDALAIAQGHSGDIHLLLTDVVMPGLNGGSLARRLCVGRPDVQVLYTTGYSERVTKLAGGDELVPLLMKPYPPRELLQRVREILDNR